MKMYMYIFFLFLILSTAAIAEVDDATVNDLNGNIPLAIPQSAAFSILGVTPDTIVDPENGRELVAATLQGLDRNGNLQAGLAIEFSPYDFVLRRAKKAEDCNKDLRLDEKKREGCMEFLKYAFKADPSLGRAFLQGMKVSFATAAGLEDEDNASRYALGLNWSYRFNDRLHSSKYQTCLKDKVFGLIGEFPVNPDLSEEVEKKEKENEDVAVRNAKEACVVEFLSEWTVQALAVGAAITKTEEEKLKVNDAGQGFWATYSHPFIVDKLDGTIHIRIINDQYTISGVSLEKADLVSLAARMRYGSKKARLILEGSWNREEVNQEQNEYGLYSVGGEIGLTKDLWFRIAYGDVIGSTPEKEDVFSGQLRFGFGAAPLSSFVTGTPTE